MNMFASLAIACTITIAVPTISLAENYIISKSTNWGDYTLENYNHRARMLHGGETLTILNDAIVTFDFTNSSSAIPITNGGCIIYSVDFSILVDTKPETSQYPAVLFWGNPLTQKPAMESMYMKIILQKLNYRIQI